MFPEDYISIKLLKKKNGRVLGRRMLYQLQTLHNDHVSDEWYSIYSERDGTILGKFCFEVIFLQEKRLGVWIRFFLCVFFFMKFF